MSNTTRWTPLRKAELIRKLATGEVSLDDAAKAHGFSCEELSEWVLRLKSFGINGLRTTRTQEYRRAA